MNIILTEVQNKTGVIAKKYDVKDDGSFTTTPAANIYEAVGKTIELDISSVGSYFDELAKRDNTCVLLGVWPGSEDWDEYDIVTELSGTNPLEGRISRTGKFIEYANSGSISLAYLDFDGDHSSSDRLELLRELDVLLEDALIGETGTARSRICKWLRPSTSASVNVNGVLGNGLHVFLPLKSASPEFIKYCHQYSWLRNKGHKLTVDGKIIAESMIDPAVRGAERIVYTSDAVVSGPKDLYHPVVRECVWEEGGVIDCEVAVRILKEVCADYQREWLKYKRQAESNPETVLRRKEWIASVEANHIANGIEKKQARRMAKAVGKGMLLSSESLLKSDGSSVPVLSVLLDRDSYIGVGEFADPVSGELGRNVGMILGDDSGVVLHSFANHGGVFQLAWGYEDLLSWVGSADEDEIEDNFGMHLAQAELSNVQEEKIVKEISKRLQVSVAVARNEVKDAKKEVASSLDVPEVAQIDADEAVVAAFVGEDGTHGDIADAYIGDLGEVKSYGNGLYVWGSGSTIWNKQTDKRTIKEIRGKYNHVARCGRASDYSQITKLIFNDSDILVDKWNRSYGIPCSDKFYAVSSAGMVPVEYTKELGCRFKLGFKPDFTMKTPLFDKLLGNVDNVVLLQQVAGLALSGYLHKMQKIMTLRGEGGSGKGTMNNILTSMLPREQVSYVDIEQMNSDKHVVYLADSQINVISEIDSNKALTTTGIKKLTGGEYVSGWVLYGGTVSFMPQCCHVLNFNKWPKLDSGGPEMFRRLGQTIVSFTRRSVDQIDDLADQIIEKELPGVLAWMLCGIESYFTDGLFSSESEEYFHRWVSSFDPITLFFEECVKFKPRGRVLRSELWNAFEKFCNESSYYLIKKGAFFAEVESYKKVSLDRYKEGVFFCGLEL